FAPEVITAFARLDGKPVGIVASQPKHKGGVLFVDSADKAARFIWLCDAFGIPILYLADVPGFMIGTKVEREGIIRHGAKMIMAVSEATVPKVSVIVRKAYGAGLYAFGGPAFEPDATLALPQAMIAVMGPEAAVDAQAPFRHSCVMDPPLGRRATTRRFLLPAAVCCALLAASYLRTAAGTAHPSQWGYRLWAFGALAYSDILALHEDRGAREH